jgi:hypothetical protein
MQIALDPFAAIPQLVGATGATVPAGGGPR